MASARRALKMLLVGLVGLLVLSAAAVLSLLGTAPGRAQIVAWLLPVLDRVLPGRFEIDELTHVSLEHVSARGVRIYDPTGTLVIRADSVSADVNLLPLLESKLLLPHVTLTGGLVDLHFLERTDRGLVAAFVDLSIPDEPSAQPSTFRVSLPDIRAQNVRVLRQVPVMGELAAEVLRLQGSFRLDGAIDVDVQDVRARLADDQGFLLETDHGKARYLSDGESLLKAELRMGETALQLRARAPIPRDAEADGPVRLSLGVSNLGAATLLRLHQPEAAEALAGTLDATLEITGTQQALRGELKAHTEGGDARLTLALDQLSRLAFAASTRALDLSRVIAGATPERVSLELQGDADLSNTDAGIPVAARLTEGQLGGQRLPVVHASAVLHPARLTQLSVEASGYGVELHASGELGYDAVGALKVRARIPSLARQKGALVLNADVELAPERTLHAQVMARAKTFAAYGLRLGALELGVSLHGKLSAPRGTVHLRARRLERGEMQLSNIDMDVLGTSSTYRVSARAALPKTQITLAGSVKRDADALRVDASASAQREGRKYDLDVRQAVIGFDGGVLVHDAQLTSAGQLLELDVSHGLRGAKDRVAVSGDGVDLAALSTLLALPKPLSGKLNLRLSAQGDLRHPDLEAELDASSVRLGEAMPLDAELSAHVEGKAGKAELELRAHGGAGMEGSARLSGQFPTSRPLSTDELLQGDYDFQLLVPSLNSAFLSSWTGGPAWPADIHLNAEVSGQGKPLAPRIAVKAHAELTTEFVSRTHTVDVALRYEDAEVQLSANVDDELGRWMVLEAEAKDPEASGRTDALRVLLDGTDELGERSNFALALNVQPRPLGQLLLVAVPPQLAQVSPDLTLRLTHTTGEEPKLSLDAHASIPPLLVKQTGCTSKALTVDLTSRLDHGQLTVALSSKQEVERLRFTAKGALALLPALRGERGVSVGQVSAALKFNELKLEDAPGLCGIVRGTLRSEAVLKDILGDSPVVLMELDARDLRLGGNAGFDLVSSAELTSSALRVDGTLRVAGRRKGQPSSLRFQLPISFQRGVLRVTEEAEVDAELTLSELPLAPLSSRRTALGYAEGSVSGKVRVTGPLKAPEPKGELEIRDARLVLNALAQPLRDIRAKLRFDARKLELVSLQARDLNGTLKARGALDLHDPAARVLTAHVEAKDFPVRQNGVAMAKMALKADLNLRSTPSDMQAKLVLSDVDAWLFKAASAKGMPLEPHPDIIDEEAEREAHVAPPPVAPRTRPLRLHVDATESFWVKRADFAIKLASQLDIVLSEELALKGQISLERGSLDLIGTSFDVERGSEIVFIGGSPPDPMLKINAVHKGGRNDKVVRVTITGRAREPLVLFFVNDLEVTAGDAMMALYGRAQTGQTYESPEVQAKSIVAGLMASAMSVTARRELGAAAPMLMIDPGEQGAGAKVRAGFELDTLIPNSWRHVVRGLYAEGVVAPSDKQAQSSGVTGAGVLIELYFPYHLVGTGAYGPGTTWSVDLGWEP